MVEDDAQRSICEAPITPNERYAINHTSNEAKDAAEGQILLYSVDTLSMHRVVNCYKGVER